MGPPEIEGPANDKEINRYTMVARAGLWLLLSPREPEAPGRRVRLVTGLK